MEYEKFNDLQAKCRKMQEDYHRQLQEADSKKQKALEELTDFYETKLHEKRSQLEQVMVD